MSVWGFVYIWPMYTIDLCFQSVLVEGEDTFRTTVWIHPGYRHMLFVSPSEASELRTVCTCCTASKSSASFCFILIQHFAVAPMSQVSDGFNANSVWFFSYRTSVPLIPVAYFYWEQMRNPLSSQWHTVCRETAAFISFLPLRKPIHTQPKRISIIQYMWFSETQRGHVLL